MIEVCHGIEPVRQPSPARNEGGDCFACALTAALRWMFPERAAEISFDEVWDCFIVEYYDSKAQSNLGKLREAVDAHLDAWRTGGGGIATDAFHELARVQEEVSAEKPATTTCNSWGRNGMEKAIRRAAEKWAGGWGGIEVEYEILKPSFEIETWSHAWFGFEPVGSWSKSLERWLRSGYVAISEQDYAGLGQMDAEQRLRSIDHITLIDGVRYGWGEWRNGGRGIEYEAHVVCSARDPYWIPVRDLLRKHGVAGLMFVRPDAR